MHSSRVTYQQSEGIHVDRYRKQTSRHPCNDVLDPSQYTRLHYGGDW